MTQNNEALEWFNEKVCGEWMSDSRFHKWRTEIETIRQALQAKEVDVSGLRKKEPKEQYDDDDGYLENGSDYAREYCEVYGWNDCLDHITTNYRIIER